MNVDSFSIAPCVQKEASSIGAIASCRLLHEAGVTVSLRGPVPEQLTVMRAGFPLKVRAAHFFLLVLVGRDPPMFAVENFKSKAPRLTNGLWRRLCVGTVTGW